MRSWLAGRVHLYYFLLAFFGGIILGIVASNFIRFELFSGSLVLMIGLVLLAISSVKFRRFFILFLLITGVLLGIWRGSNEKSQVESIQQFYSNSVVVRGIVVDDVTVTARDTLSFKLRNIVIDNQQFDGQIWVSATKTDNIVNRSDTVTVEGFMSEGFGSFGASLIRADIEVIERTSSGDIGLQIRDSFVENTNLPEPEKSLGLGFLLGLKSTLPESFEQQIMILGLTHVVVASGYNLTILVAFARRIFASVSKYLSAICGFGMIAGFIAITGFSPSMSRAGLVAGLSLMAWYYGRKIHPFALLLIAAAITLFINPAYIWGDLGWYLSFTAFFGILVLAPLLHDYFWGLERKPSALRELLVATFAAQIMTLPIILYSFGLFSIYTLPANALILPIIPFSMLAVFVAGIGGMVLPSFSVIFAAPANWLLHYCTYVIDRLASLPNARSEIELSAIAMGFCYLGIAVITIFLLRKTKHNFLKDKLIID